MSARPARVWAAARPEMPEPTMAARRKGGRAWPPKIDERGSAYTAQTPSARGAGKQRPAKRPETKEGGREEEEFRLGIASGHMSGRLRSAKTWAVGRASLRTAMGVWRTGGWKKFRNRVCMVLPAV